MSEKSIEVVGFKAINKGIHKALQTKSVLVEIEGSLNAAATQFYDPVHGSFNVKIITRQRDGRTDLKVQIYGTKQSKDDAGKDIYVEHAAVIEIPGLTV